MSRRLRIRSAFTLLETVAALALFVLCSGVLLQTIGNARTAVDSTWRADVEDADLRLVFQKILGAPDASSAVREGRMSTISGGHLFWKTQVEPTDTVDLHRVTVALVREEEPGRREEKTVVLYALRPAWSDPVRREELLSRLRSARVDSGRGAR